MCSRQHLHPIPLRTQTSRHRHLFAGLFGRSRSCIPLSICHLLIYTYTFVSFTVSVSIRVFCVDGPSPCFFSLLVRNRASLSLFPLPSPALRFKTPMVPPRFSTQAHNNGHREDNHRLNDHRVYAPDLLRRECEGLPVPPEHPPKPFLLRRQ